MKTQLAALILSALTFATLQMPALADVRLSIGGHRHHGYYGNGYYGNGYYGNGYRQSYYGNNGYYGRRPVVIRDGRNYRLPFVRLDAR
jgi:hypothetical protein